MKVITMLNGSLSSEAVAFYALKFCKVHDFELELLHIKNKKDSIASVENSMETVETLAKAMEVKTVRKFFGGFNEREFIRHVETGYVDTIFSSSRAKKSLFKDSFSEKIVKLSLDCDIAVVRVVNLSMVNNVDAILLPIQEARLSAGKFSLFATMAKTYEAEAEIYSITLTSRKELAKEGLEETKKRLLKIDTKLSHYKKLANLAQFPYKIKHAYSLDEMKQILHHGVRKKSGLIIFGAKRYSFFSIFNLKRFMIEKLMKETPINLIAYYPKSER